MITVKLTAPFKGLPSGSTLSVESLSTLDHYSADGFYNLNTTDGGVLRFMDVFSGVDVIKGDLMAAISAAKPSA